MKPQEEPIHIKCKKKDMLLINYEAPNDTYKIYYAQCILEIMFELSYVYKRSSDSYYLNEKYSIDEIDTEKILSLLKEKINNNNKKYDNEDNKI